MSEKTSYEPGVPCWVDLSTTDLPGALSFYRRLFGWDAEDMGEQAGHYTMLRLAGSRRRRGRTPDAGAGGPPPAWNVYVAVTDADATAKAIESAGGRLLMPPMDVFTSGRMAVAMDPQGAAFSIWQARDHIGSGSSTSRVRSTWTELATRDVEGAFAFYSAVFGWGRKDTDRRRHGLHRAVGRGTQRGRHDGDERPVASGGAPELDALLRRRRHRRNGEAGHRAGRQRPGRAHRHPTRPVRRAQRSAGRVLLHHRARHRAARLSVIEPPG